MSDYRNYLSIMSDSEGLKVHLPDNRHTAKMSKHDRFLAGCFMIGSGTSFIDGPLRGLIRLMCVTRAAYCGWRHRGEK